MRSGGWWDARGHGSNVALAAGVTSWIMDAIIVLHYNPTGGRIDEESDIS